MLIRDPLRGNWLVRDFTKSTRVLDSRILVRSKEVKRKYWRRDRGRGEWSRHRVLRPVFRSATAPWYSGEHHVLVRSSYEVYLDLPNQLSHETDAISTSFYFARADH